MARLAGQLAAECVAVGRAEGAQARNGVVPRLGARHAIPTPVTDAIVPLLRACGPATG